MGEKAGWTWEQELPAEAGSISMARRFVSGTLTEPHLAHLVDDIGLVVSELATNAVRHANTSFTVRLEEIGQSVLLTVTDGSSQPPVRRPEEDSLEPGGRGLAIVDSLSGDWGVLWAGHGPGKSVWASFALVADPLA